MRNFSGTFEETTVFGEVRDMFEQAFQLTEQERYEEWDTFYGENILDVGIYLLQPSGEKMTDFILHIHRQEAWGRLP